jgi:hypothetical protein
MTEKISVPAIGECQKTKKSQIAQKWLLTSLILRSILVRTMEPYTLQEKGWGAFDLRIIFHFVDNLIAPQLMWFDLNFAQEAYSVIETLVSLHY